jgi:hypothetical protein
MDLQLPDIKTVMRKTKNPKRLVTLHVDEEDQLNGGLSAPDRQRLETYLNLCQLKDGKLDCRRLTDEQLDEFWGLASKIDTQQEQSS